MTVSSPSTRSASAADRLHAATEAQGSSFVQTAVRLLSGPLKKRHTLLAICPNSEAVAHAALTAAQAANAPLLYAATLNQVDRDGGYTGWTPQSFADFVNAEKERLGITVPVILCLDHGGPWKKDRHVIDDLSYEDSMAAVNASLEACIDAGYRLLHIDPTEDRRLPSGTPVPPEDIVARTVELMRHAEAYRHEHGYPPLAYEVGTEEVGGGLQSEDRLKAFLTQLKTQLDEHDLPHPSFVVGDVGTKLDTDYFNPVRARRLTRHAEAIGALLKGHYTDSVAHPEAYPVSGMGGANVGPGLTAQEYHALMELVDLEKQLGRDSGFRRALRQAVIDSERWTKWLQPEEHPLTFDDLSPERQDWLIETGSRYVWTDPDVEEARTQLYANVDDYRDAEAFVHWRVQESILRYFHAFNLIDFNDVLLDALEGTPHPA